MNSICIVETKFWTKKVSLPGLATLACLQMFKKCNRTQLRPSRNIVYHYQRTKVLCELGFAHEVKVLKTYLFGVKLSVLVSLLFLFGLLSNGRDDFKIFVNF